MLHDDRTDSDDARAERECTTLEAAKECTLHERVLDLAELAARFVGTFERAIELEMAAMRERMGPFEVLLGQGQVHGDGAQPGETSATELALHYRFELARREEKLVLGSECTLRCGRVEHLVKLVEIDAQHVVLASDARIDMRTGPWLLVIYPWFLYEKLKEALSACLKDQTLRLESALRLFGKVAPRVTPAVLSLAAPGLDDSQLRAVQLCVDSDLAFVWGPPGTGKTTTLAQIVAELMARGQRILLCSNTNAAVDQALAKLATRPDVATAIERGAVVRIGNPDRETPGTLLDDVTQRICEKQTRALQRLRDRRAHAKEAIQGCTRALAKLDASVSQQQDLFTKPNTERLSRADLLGVFERPDRFRNTQAPALHKLLQIRKRRLENIDALCARSIARLRKELAEQESGIVSRAELVVTTLTNVYFNAHLAPERFDAVIVEEAGMALLPHLFYAACLARERLIIIGDPRQLPAIVQSNDEYVWRALGRNIFEVSAPDPLASPSVALLDTQYRMHPEIADLVSSAFYDGRLKTAWTDARVVDIVRRAPYPEAALIVVDTSGQTVCNLATNTRSRLNPNTSELCTKLAAQALALADVSVAVITPYAAQAKSTRERLFAAGLPNERVECHTVHRFQGNERDIVIFDTVDAAPLAPGVLLTDMRKSSAAANLINVSISRARAKLIVVADLVYFRERAPNSPITRVLDEALRRPGVTLTSVFVPALPG